MSTKAESDSWVLVGKDGRTHDLSLGMIFIGREECDIVLQALSADKRHAVLCYHNNEQCFRIKDLNSLTGTYVNGHRIAEQEYVPLKRLDCIRFGYGPDVFYLENTSLDASIPVSEKPSSQEIMKKSHSTENSKPEKTESSKSNKKPHQRRELPSFSREENPPDSLALNLSSNSKREEKEWDWLGRDGTLSDSPDYSQRSETSSCSAPPTFERKSDERDTGSAHSSPAATAFTIAFETEACTPRKKLGIRDSISKFAPSKDSENRPLFQKSSKTEPSPKKCPSADAKPPIPKHRSQSNHPEFKDVNKEIGKITDSTSFLIKKMLNGEASPPERVSDPMTNHRHPNQDVDEKSEAGTYTVEMEQGDGDVEEARKKIDEVFGVVQLEDGRGHLPLYGSASGNKQIPRLNGRLKQPVVKTPVTPKQREQRDSSTPQWNPVTKSYERRRSSNPTPTVSVENLTHGDSLPRNFQQRTRRIVPEPPLTPERLRKKLPIPTGSPRSPAKNRTQSFKSPGNISNNLSVMSGNKELSSKEDLLRRHSTDTRSEGSKSPHTSLQWQSRVPWNLSGSDLELERSKSENNSIMSDSGSSNEPSTHSSHSGHAHSGPQMRLNRAFALRRARLEAESGKRNKENRASIANQPKLTRKSGKLSSSTSTLREESSSGGSGRLSVRLPSNSHKVSLPNRQSVQYTDPLKRKIVSSHNMEEYQCRSSGKELTALDSLVISAIHQLASKLWCNSKDLLERERKKCPKGSDTWLMIDEVLPQGPIASTPEDGDFTKDLSSILKNLKRVEQGLDVLSSILENGRDPEPGIPEKTNLPQNFFVVNM